MVKNTEKVENNGFARIAILEGFRREKPLLKEIESWKLEGEKILDFRKVLRSKSWAAEQMSSWKGYCRMGTVGEEGGIVE